MAQYARKVLCALICLIAALGMVIPAHAEDIAVQRASLAADARGGWQLETLFAFELNSSLEEAINKGIALCFTTEFILTRPRWYWFDEETVSRAQNIRLSYQPLTRQYRISSGGLQLGFSSLSDALAVIKHVTAWHVIDAGELTPGKTYTASVRMHLNTALMPKPFQINAVNNRDWNLASDWKHFTFTASQYAR